MLQGIRGNVVQFLDDGILKSKVKVEQRETRVVCLFSSTEEAEILPFFFFSTNREKTDNWRSTERFRRIFPRRSMENLFLMSVRGSFGGFRSC